MLKEYISIEDIEDQFLRLKEVLNYNISISFKWSSTGPYYQVIIAPMIIKKGKAYEELKQVIRRTEIIYPKIEVYTPEYTREIYYLNIEFKESKERNG